MQLTYSANLHLLFTFIAFILCMLCIFAGSKPGYLETGDMLTLNTFMLGHMKSKRSKIVDPVVSNAKNDINNVASTVVNSNLVSGQCFTAAPTTPPAPPTPPTATTVACYPTVTKCFLH